jgi:hypothetical protein
VGEFKKKSYERNFALLRLASTDSNVYYAHVRDAPGDLQPLRRHEQIVSPKKVYFANLRLASTDTGVYYAHPRLVGISDLYDATSSV